MYNQRGIYMSIYLDNAATSYPKPREVADAVYDFMINNGTSSGRGSYQKAMESDFFIYNTRKEIASLFIGNRRCRGLRLSEKENMMKSEEVTRILENAIRIGKGVIRYGSVASYIPELAKADKNKLGICLYTIDGNQFETGNTEDRFTIQSISKVMALCLALETFGAEFVFDHVGVEPSGEAFNSLVELDNRSNRPFNPMINSGAITVASLLVNHYSIEDMQKYMQEVCEDPEIAIDEAVFQSEMATCARNKAIAYLLKSKDIIDTDVEESVTFYTKMCSMSVNARDLARFGLLLANDGVQLSTGKRLISSQTVRMVQTIMLTCGMYDGSGEFALRTGIPTKSGVGGGLLSVSKKKMGIGIYGPSLDKKGNCIAGCELLGYISEALHLHIFDTREWKVEE